MLRIRSAQISALMACDVRFADWYVEDVLKNFFPQFYFSVSDQGKREMVLNGRRYAQGFGLTENEAQAYFITLMWDIGPNFYEFPGFRDVLKRSDLEDMQKIELIFSGGVTDEQAVVAIMQADDRYWYRESLETMDVR